MPTLNKQASRREEADDRKTVVQKTVEPPPWVFHMCWTANKGEKLRCVPSRAPLPSPP